MTSWKGWKQLAMCVALWGLQAQAQGLPDDIKKALEQARLPASALHVVVAPATGGPPLFALQAEKPVNPASLMKLVTTGAALDMLGPTYTWRTPVLTDGDITGGELRGNLYLQGRGDPKLVSERLWLLMRRIKALGIDRVRGDIVLDQSAFDGPVVDPGAFDGEPTRPYNVSPQALLINFKSVLLHFNVDPAQRIARLHVEPPLNGTRWPTEIPLQPGPCTDYRASLKADFSNPTDWKFRGAYPADCGERIWPIADLDPNTFAQRAIEGMWRNIGGELTGQVRAGRITASAKPLLMAESPTLAEVIRDINKFSNNLMAEQLFLTLSLQAGGVGRPEASRALIRRWWEQNIGVAGLEVDNGSGLSRTGRVSAMGLGTLLQRLWIGPCMPELMASLPISSVDGTLRRSGAQAQAHLKTGSLKNVLGVAGYVDGEQGQRWVLVAIIEHPQAQNGRKVLDTLIDWAAGARTHQP
jgi:D-alanyl-D-alanine carboxypeptidase/D-alanyl-D-alanine-endopeptidase (penicillin-binding protein 4)